MKMYISQHANSASLRNTDANISPPNQHSRTGFSLNRNFIASIFIVLLSLISFFYPIGEADANENFVLHWSSNISAEQTLYDLGSSPDLPSRAGVLAEYPVNATRRYLLTPQDRVGVSGDWREYNQQILSVEENGEDRLVCHDTGQILDSLFLASPFGNWYVGANLQSGRTTVRGIWFCPNPFALRPLIDVGETVQSRLKVTRQHFVDKIVNTTWQNVEEKYLTLTISRVDDLSITWNVEEDSMIVGDGSATYSDRVGVVNGDQAPVGIEFRYASKELKFGEAEIIGDTPNTRNSVDSVDWPGWEKPSGDNLVYGTWHLGRDFDKFLFRPNASAVNQLTAGETVISTLTVSWAVSSSSADYDPTSEQILATKQVSVEIRGPKVELSISDAIDVVIEGEPALFKITANNHPNGGLDVVYEPFNSIGNFLDETDGASRENRTSTLFFSKDGESETYSATLEVPTLRTTDIVENQGVIGVRLVNSPLYQVSQSRFIAVADVSDTTIPLLSISDAADIRPGETAYFPVFSNIDPGQSLTVTYAPRNGTGGNLLDTSEGLSGAYRTTELNFSRSGNSEYYTAFLEVPTVVTDQTSGRISVRLVGILSQTPPYVLSRGPFATEGSVLLSGSPFPQLSITNISTPINEGETAAFEVEVNTLPEQALNVSFVPVNLEGNFLDTSNGDSGVQRSASLTFAQSDDGYTAQLEVPTSQPNRIDEVQGQISLELIEGSGYTVSPVNSVGTVFVNDADVPVLSIESSGSTIAGKQAEFTVSADILPQGPLSVLYTPVNTIGEFMDTTGGDSGAARTLELTFSESQPHTALISVPTVVSVRPAGEITVTLAADASVPRTYELAESAENQFAATVVSFPIPELSMRAINRPVVEGDTATFNITTDTNPISQLDVLFTASNVTGNFIDAANYGGNASQSLDFTRDSNTGIYRANLEIPTRAPNGVDEVDGEISVVLQASEDYNLNTDATSGTAVVYDADALELSIFGGAKIAAGEAATFTIISNIRPLGAVSVTYTASNSTGQFLDPSENTDGVSKSSNFTFTENISSGQFSADLVLPTVVDPNLASGVITVTLNNDSEVPATYVLDNSNQTASVAVGAFPVPELSVVASELEITEGESVLFTVTAGVNPVRSLQVFHSIRNLTGNFLDTTDGDSGTVRSSSLNFVRSTENGNYSATIEVPTFAPNGVDEDSGMISLVLEPSAEYTISDVGGSDTVVVLDAEVPRLSIDAEVSVLVGENAIFTVTSDLQPWQALPVSYVPENTLGEFIDISDGASGIARTSSLVFTETPPYTATFQVPTVNSNESAGKFTVTLVDDESEPRNYALSEVIDEQSAIATVYYPTPELSLDGIEMPITEGGTAYLKITASIDPLKQLNVRYSTANVSGNFIDELPEGSETSQILEFFQDESTGLYTAILGVQTRNPNGLDEVNGEISVELADSEEYSLSSDSFQTTVSVIDADTPTLQIISGPEVEAGNSTKFTIVSDIQPFESLAVGYTPENTTGNFLDASQISVGVVNTSVLNFVFDEGRGISEAVLAIPTANDPKSDTGIITVTLNEDAGIANSYKLGAKSLTASNTIIGIAAPELSVYAVETEMTEGESLQFAVTASVNPDSDLPVLHTLSNQSGDFLDTTGGESDSIRTTTLTFTQSEENSEFTAMIVVPTNAPNGLDEESGIISIALAPSERYSVSDSNGSASVSIVDAEVPRLSIDIAGEVLAGDDAVFTVTSDMQPWRNLSVTFVPANISGEFIETSQGVSGATRTTELVFSETAPFTSTIRVPTVVSGGSEGKFVVTLQDDASDARSYALANNTDDHSATATLYFSAPEISIHDIESPINEGDTATFKLSTSDLVIQQLEVSYSPSNTSGNFLMESLVGSTRTHSLEFMLDKETGQRVANLAIPTRAANGQDEVNGIISVELLPLEGYTLNATQFKANVAVYDVDIPVLSFSDNTDVRTGETANLELVSDIRPVDSLTVSYTPVNTTGQFLDISVINPGVRNTNSLTFAWNEESGNFTANLPIPTVADQNLENGEITVTLSDDEAEFTTYVLAGSNQSASVFVNTPGIPELSIYSVAPVFTEGETIRFTVAANVHPMSNLQIFYSANNLTGGFLDTTDGNSGSPRSVELNFSESSEGENYVATLEVPTNEVNGKDEEDGSINVALLESSAYTIHPQLGNDTVTIVDADIPALSISAVSDSVDAGQIAEFLVTSDILPLQQLVVAYVPTNDSGDFLDPAEGESGITRTSTLQFEQNGEGGSISAAIEINTNKVPSSENGSISVRLVDSQDTLATYTVDQELSLVTINFVPTVSIGVESDRISEGENIVVNFTALPAPSRNMRARIAVEGSGKTSFFQVPRVVTFRPGQSIEQLVLKSYDNRKNLSDDFVTIRLTEISDSKYEITGGSSESDDNSITVLIENVPYDDNGNKKTKYAVVSSVIKGILTKRRNGENSSETADNGESQRIEISIEPVTNEVAEGRPASFIIKSSQPVQQDVTVALRLSEKGNFISGESTVTEVLTRASKIRYFAVETIDDDIPEDDGQVIVEITDTSAYEISSNSTAIVNVSDENDRMVERKLAKRINREVLPLFFNSIQATAARSASRRVKNAFSGMEDSKFESDFQQSFKGLLRESGDFIDDNSALWQSLLDDSSFALNLSEDNGAAIPTTVWAVSDHGDLSEIGIESHNTLEGSIYSGQVGLETKSEEGVLVGLSTLVSNANVDHRSQELGKVSFDALSTSLHPYFGIKSNNDRFNLHSTVGFGLGSVDVDQSNKMLNSLNTSYYNSATGISQTLFKSDSVLGGAGELNLAGETWHTGQYVESENDSSDSFNATEHHYNFMLDGEHKSTLSSGEMLLSTASIGLGGHTIDNRTQLGVELKNGVKFDNVSGLRISSMANTLLSQKHGVSHSSNVSVDFDSGNDNLGLFSKNTFAWSHSESGDNYNPEQDGPMGFNLFDPQAEQMDSVSARAEFGYGIGIPEQDYVVTPFSVLEFSAPRLSEILLGVRINSGTNMAVEFEGSLEKKNSVFSGTNFTAGGNVKW